MRDDKPMCPERTTRKWCRKRDSNPRPPHYECGALPTELLRREIRVPDTGRRPDWQARGWDAPVFPSPRERSEWRGGGRGGGGPGARSKCSPPTPSAFASLTRPTLPANGREGRCRASLL